MSRIFLILELVQNRFLFVVHSLVQKMFPNSPGTTHFLKVSNFDVTLL